jgi:hypothetical protein
MVDGSSSKLLGAVVILGFVGTVAVGAIVAGLPMLIDGSPSPLSITSSETERPPQLSPPTATRSTPRPDAETPSSAPTVSPRSSSSPSAGQVQFAITRIEPCGPRCRVVTATLANTRSHAIHDIVVETQLAAGETQIATTRKRIGTLRAGGSVTLTSRITIDVRDAVAIKATNGHITMTTIIISNTGRHVSTVRRDIT